MATTIMAADLPPGCSRGDCGLRQATAYPNIVVGRIVNVASDDEMRQLYRWARPGAWKAFADDEVDYLRRNRLFIVTADGQGTQVMLHMSHEEFRRISFGPGDLVRYIPHRRGNAGVDETLYSDLAGCIAVLCRGNDSACAQRYRPGVYRSDGFQIDFTTEKRAEGDAEIDTLSMLPKPDFN